MDFLDSSVLPQSGSHLVLLKYLLVLTFIIFSTYIGVLLGSLSLSLHFRRKYSKTANKLYQKFSKDLIDLVTFNKGTAFALGIVPVLSSAFCYAQLLHLANVNVPEYLFVSLLLLLAALVIIYTYKYTFHLKDIFNFAGEKNVKEGEEELLKNEIESYSIKTGKLNEKTGYYGLLLLIIATYIFNNTVQLASDTTRWTDGGEFFGMLFSLTTIASYLQFIAVSFALTCAAILYYFFKPGGTLNPSSEEYSFVVKSFALKLGLVSVISLPALVVLSIIVKPAASLSFGVFGFTVIALILLLFISSLFYFMIKESSLRYRTSIIFTLVIAFAFLIIKDQYAFDTSTKLHTAVLAVNFEEYEKQILEESGAAPAVINGADIYNGKCIACHKYDVKLVGPPYKETLPKYEGKMDQLVQFILNPKKINPEYPVMPSQGLKPNEAEAVAKYIMETYKTK